MGKVISHVTMSLDGFVSTHDDDPQELFDWYGAGEVEVASANDSIDYQLDDSSADLLGGLIGASGALISGRRLFDIADGWGDSHPIGAPVVVVTHTPPEDADRWPRTTFVGDVETAVARAKEIAGEGDVTIASPSIIQQALALGLLDEIAVSLVPVLFGSGVAYFGDLGRHVMLDDPEIVPGRRALHLRYRVRR